MKHTLILWCLVGLVMGLASCEPDGNSPVTPAGDLGLADLGDTGQAAGEDNKVPDVANVTDTLELQTGDLGQNDTADLVPLDTCTNCLPDIAGCPPEKPYEENSECYECLDDTHCGEEEVCMNHLCKPGDIAPECSYCAEPYPACVQVNGVWSCVECLEDADCAEGTCETSSYACVVPSCFDLGTCFEGCGQCTEDSDCVSTHGLALACDKATSCCYDSVMGFCDGVESNCLGGGPCVLKEDLVNCGLTIPGVAKLLGPDSPGVCLCTDPSTEDPLGCLLGGGACPYSPNCEMGTCVSFSALGDGTGCGIEGLPANVGVCVGPSFP